MADAVQVQTHARVQRAGKVSIVHVLCVLLLVERIKFALLQIHAHASQASGDQGAQPRNVSKRALTEATAQHLILVPARLGGLILTALLPCALKPALMVGSV